MKKKLYRSRTNKVFGGLIGGLAEYFDVDPILFRLIFVFAVFMSGFVPGILAYIVGLMIVPNERLTVPGEKNSN